MSDTNNPTVQTVQRRPRIKDALALGIIDTTKAGARIVGSTANVVEALSTRIKLHNISTAADIIDEYGADKISLAQQLISKL
jgi:hypothetical protein